MNLDRFPAAAKQVRTAKLIWIVFLFNVGFFAIASKVAIDANTERTAELPPEAAWVLQGMGLLAAIVAVVGRHFLMTPARLRSTGTGEGDIARRWMVFSILSLMVGEMPALFGVVTAVLMRDLERAYPLFAVAAFTLFLLYPSGGRLTEALESPRA